MEEALNCGPWIVTRGRQTEDKICKCIVVQIWLTSPGQESSYMDELAATQDIADVGVGVSGGGKNTKTKTQEK